MLPLLKVVSNGEEFKLKEVVEILAKQFKLTDKERSELLPSGQAFIFSDRVAWARTYLKKSGFLEESNVPRPEIQKFVCALAGQRAKKGVFITTSNFSKDAIAYAAQMDAKIVLIDGEQLAQYMIDYNLGVSIQNIYKIKKLDLDYFEEE